MFNKLGAQLYTIRDFMDTPEHVRESFKRLKNMGYDQAQTAGSQIDYAVFGQIAKEEGLELVGTHESFQRMVDDFDEAMRLHKLLGANVFGVGGASVNTNDVAVVEKAIADMNTICAKLKPYGLKFSYHNHSHEFRRLSTGKTILETIVDGLDKENGTICLDTFWVQNGGGDVRHWIEKLAGRIEILHLKDCKKPTDTAKWFEQEYCEIGQGNLWWEGILDAAEKTGVKYYVVEQDVSEDPFKSLEISSNYLHKFMK